MMKKSSLFTAGLLMAFTLGGCGNSGQEDNAALQQQVAELQQQIAEMQQSQQNNSDAGTTSTEDLSASGNSTGAASADHIEQSAQSASSGDNSGTQTAYTIEELTAKAEDFMQRASDIVSAKDTPEMEQFFSLKKELSQLERDLDVHEDEIEGQYRSGALSRDAYREQERALEALDDRLDETEDRLELKFGIMD